MNIVMLKSKTLEGMWVFLINYGYNRLSAKGMSLRHLLKARFNEGMQGLNPSEPKGLEERVTPATLTCRLDGGYFIVPDNTASIQRPMYRVRGFLERAWGAFHTHEDGRVIDQVNLTHEGQEVMVSYTHPLSDETLKICIDAGMYRDPRFEEVMNRLLFEESFDIQHDVRYEFMEAPLHIDGVEDRTPIILMDAHDIYATEDELYDKSSIDDMLKRAALIAIDLTNQGVESEALVDYKKAEPEPVVPITFTDVVDTFKQEEETKVPTTYIERSDLLDEPIDLTDKLKDVIAFNTSSEEERIIQMKKEAKAGSLPTIQAHEEQIENERQARLERQKAAQEKEATDEGLDM